MPETNVDVTCRPFESYSRGDHAAVAACLARAAEIEE
jgi:hypothetical protein